MNNQIEWTTQQGQSVRITITAANTYLVQVNEKKVTHCMGFGDVPTVAKAKAKEIGVVALLGPVAITSERKASIEALEAVLFPPQSKFRLPRDLVALEDELERTHSWVLRHGDNPAPAYAAQTQAQTALDAWKTANLEAWLQVVAFRTAKHVKKNQELAQSFAHRGLD